MSPQNHPEILILLDPNTYFVNIFFLSTVFFVLNKFIFTPRMLHDCLIHNHIFILDKNIIYALNKGKQISNESVGESSNSLLNESSSSSAAVISKQPHQTPTAMQEQQDAMMATPSDAVADHNKLPTTALQLGKRLIANLMPSSAFQQLKIPFPDDEHYLTSAESIYYVNERSLTSIAAYSLGCVMLSCIK